MSTPFRGAKTCLTAITRSVQTQRLLGAIQQGKNASLWSLKNLVYGSRIACTVNAVDLAGLYAYVGAC